MKQLYFLTTSNLANESGERTHIIELTNNLAQYFDVQLFAEHIGHDLRLKLKEKGIRAVAYKRALSNAVFRLLVKLSLLAKFLIMAKKRQPDSLYVRLSAYTILLGLLQRFWKQAVVVEVNGLLQREMELRGTSKPIRRLLERMEGYLLQHARAIVCVSEGIRNELIRRYGLSANKCFTIPNGVNEELFQPISRHEASSELNLADDADITVGFIGNLAAWQNLFCLFDAVKIIQTESDYRVRLLIIGAGEMMPPLQSHCDKLAISQNVIFTGRVAYQDIPFYVNMLDLGMLVDKRVDGGNALFCPLKLFEYLAAGVPVISFENPEIDFIEKEDIGYLVPPNDPRSVAEAIITHSKRTDVDVMSVRARQYIVDHYTWSKTASSVAELLGHVGSSDRNIGF